MRIIAVLGYLSGKMYKNALAAWVFKPPWGKRKVPAFVSKAGTHYGAPGGIRTHGLPLRRRSLYPTELRVHVPENSVFSRVFRHLIVMILFSFLLTNRPVLGLSC